MRWCAVVAAVFSQLFSAVMAQEPETEAPPISAEVAADLKALSDREFQVRESAGRRLISLRKEAVVPLAHLARTGTAEASVRAFDLLRQLYREGDDEMVEAVESAYESLLQSDNPVVAARAEARIEASVSVRHRRAMNAVKKLGGKIKFRKEVDLDQQDDDDSQRSIMFVKLDKSWVGGEEGLKHLKRLEDFRVRTEVRGAYLLVIKGCKISEEALKNLETSIPGLLIQQRGESCLGVSPYVSFGGDDGLRIGEVKPDSAADRAGLRSGDLLMKFNGHNLQPVTVLRGDREETKGSFEVLVEKIADTKPGDKVPVVYQRNGTIDTLIVEMRDWDD